MAILTARGGNGTPVSEAEVKAMLVELLDKIEAINDDIYEDEEE